jgi:hypothetical protein
MQSWNQEIRKRKIQSILINTSIFLFIVFIMLFLFFYYGQIKSVTVNSFDKNINNTQIEKDLNLFIKESGILEKNFLLISKNKVEKHIKQNFPDISKISIKRNLNTSLEVLVYRQASLFYSCDESFVVTCALGNAEGEYYKELDNREKADKNIFEIKTDIENLNKKDIDTFIGNTLLDKEKFLLLLELKKYFDKIDFKVSKIEINKLKIAKFYINNYFVESPDFYISVSLDKSYVDTIRDFEAILSSVEFGGVLKNKNSNLQYLDLSFKDKVFYK